MMLYGYKSTVGIALGTLKLSANICRHNKCRRSLTEPTTQVSTKVCNPKRGLAGETKKNPQNILPLSPIARKGKSPAAHTRATRECAHRRCLPRTPSLAASHTEPRCCRLPHRASPPQPTMPAPAAALLHSAAARRNPNHGCPIACNSASTQDVAHPRSHRLQLWICVYDSLGFGVPAAGTKSSRRCSCAGLHSGFSPLFQVRAPLLLEAALSSIRPLSPDSRIYNIPGSE